MYILTVRAPEDFAKTVRFVMVYQFGAKEVEEITLNGVETGKVGVRCQTDDPSSIIKSLESAQEEAGVRFRFDITNGAGPNTS